MRVLLLLASCWALAGCTVNKEYRTKCLGGVLYYAGNYYLAPVYNTERQVVLCNEEERE